MLLIFFQYSRFLIRDALSQKADPGREVVDKKVAKPAAKAEVKKEAPCGSPSIVSLDFEFG